MQNLAKAGKVTRCINATVAGQTTISGSSVYMKGFHTATFYVLIGTIDATGVVDVKVQQSSDDGAADAFADLTGTKVSYTATDDNKIAIVEVVAPREVYLRPVVVRSTAYSVIDGAHCIQHGADNEPVTHDSTVVGAEVHLAPAEGTA